MQPFPVCKQLSFVGEGAENLEGEEKLIDSSRGVNEVINGNNMNFSEQIVIPIADVATTDAMSNVTEENVASVITNTQLDCEDNSVASPIAVVKQ